MARRSQASRWRLVQIRYAEGGTAAVVEPFVRVPSTRAETRIRDEELRPPPAHPRTENGSG